MSEFLIFWSAIGAVVWGLLWRVLFRGSLKPDDWLWTLAAAFVCGPLAWAFVAGVVAGVRSIFAVFKPEGQATLRELIRKGAAK